jgi:hypothetical protein
VEHVEMRHAVERTWHAVEQEARFHQRHVEGPAVVGTKRAMVRGPGLHFGEHRALMLESRQQELPDADRIAIDGRATNQERLCAGAAK